MITRKPLERKSALVLFIFPPLQEDDESCGDWLNKQEKKRKSHTKFDLSVLELLFQTTYKCGLNQTGRDWIPRVFFFAGQPESDLGCLYWVACVNIELSSWETRQTSYVLHLKHFASRVSVFARSTEASE